MHSAWKSHGQKLTKWLYTTHFALRWIFSEIRVRKHHVAKDVYLESRSHLTVVVKISQRILDESESKGKEREGELENEERFREPTEVKLLLQMKEMFSEGFDANWGRFLWTVTVVALPKTPRVILFVIVVKISDLSPSPPLNPLHHSPHHNMCSLLCGLQSSQHAASPVTAPLYVTVAYECNSPLLPILDTQWRIPKTLPPQNNSS